MHSYSFCLSSPQRYEEPSELASMETLLKAVWNERESKDHFLNASNIQSSSVGRTSKSMLCASLQKDNLDCFLRIKYSPVIQ